MSANTHPKTAAGGLLALFLACIAPAACTSGEGSHEADVAPQPPATSAMPPAPAPASPAPAAAAAASAVEGIYAMPAPRVSELRVVALPGRPGVYRVEVSGGGDPADGAGAGADCQALAEGPLEGNRIEAPLLPFESPLGGLDAADLGDAPRLALTIDGDEAALEGRFAHCALATVMAGRYVRTRAPALLADCPPLPAACWMRD